MRGVQVWRGTPYTCGVVWLFPRHAAREHHSAALRFASGHDSIQLWRRGPGQPRAGYVCCGGSTFTRAGAERGRRQHLIFDLLVCGVIGEGRWQNTSAAGRIETPVPRLGPQLVPHRSTHRSAHGCCARSSRAGMSAPQTRPGSRFGPWSPRDGCDRQLFGARWRKGKTPRRARARKRGRCR